MKSDDFSEPNAKLFAATPAEEGLWQIHDLAVSNTEDGNLNSFLLSFGQDLEGEIYVITSDTPGPAGESGRVYRLVSPELAAEMVGEETGEVQEEAMGEGSEAEITIEGFAYSPEELTVSVGTTVVWTNRQSVAHTVTAGTPDAPNPDLFDSGNLNEDDKFSFTFDEAGSFDYHCTIHPSMQGTIVVEE